MQCVVARSGGQETRARHWHGTQDQAGDSG